MFFRCQRPPPVLLVLIFVNIFLGSSSASGDELQILLNLKSQLRDSNSDVFGSWRRDTPVCSFPGIVCGSDGLVTEINLPKQKLVGDLPFHSICQLPSLEKIILGENFLNGTVSVHLRNCTKLKVLDLGFNYFSGEIPDLSSLKELSFLNLNNSGFSGKFPWKSLENLVNLTFLSLGDNPFDTSPFPVEVLKLEKLYWLYLSNCSIAGEIPDGIQNLTQLQNLELADNQMTGEIPPGIVKLKNLWQLELYNNSFTGRFPVGFGNLTNLVNLDASQNMLEGDLAELSPLYQLASLQLFENQFSGQIPQEFGDFKHLEDLSLYRNRLTGPLPQKLGSWSDFNYIDVSENLLTGEIPSDMCKNGKMTDLLILQNRFTGKIPETYAHCESLIRFRINNNSLSGIVPPGIWGLPNLIVIDLRMNQFEGPLTNDIGDAKSLALLYLSENQFSGELPSRISEASSLVFIQLSSNQFSGQLPSSIGKLKKLSSFYLKANMFAGPLPASLGSCVSLTDINFAGNSFSGKIPYSLGYLPTLNSLNLSKNKLSGEIPNSLSHLKLSLLDLSNNRLVGKIPESLYILGFNTSFLGNPGLCINQCSSWHSNKSNRLLVFWFCLIAVILLVLLLLLAFYLYLKLKRKDQENSLRRNSWSMKSFRVLTFTENDIINAIKPENLIGKGGSGQVYKVVLENGKELAVKHLWPSLSPTYDQKSFRTSSPILSKSNSRPSEYDAEVATLSAVRHVNVVKLYCSITSEDSNLLVYEYLPNGSLWDKLHTSHKIKMGWEVRYAIAVGAAKGLEYLHHGCERPVIHRDVKSSNILLDEEWKPRIADFGLAKILQSGVDGKGDWTNLIAGTHGYIAPGMLSSFYPLFIFFCS